ncbi:hypothetical protein [Companilactobacillus hulinensis]|uniref:hypothetical protein n=1 Tax=Companilactobacillus hulinensis TaxID=2486007 RepID=UPI000F78B848|nr:hypothetical protein [Companilactobacillus hulinensis]
MVNFGKKVSTRPIVLGLLYGIFIGSVFGGFSIILGLVAGITAFIIVAIIYYGINLPFLFNAWSIDDQEIDYYDMSSFWKRIK